MATFMEHIVQVTFQATVWSGWNPDGYSIVTSAKLWAEKGRALGPATLGHSAPEGEAGGGMFYEVLVGSIVTDRVGFAYRGLVISNPDGTINLSAPSTGQFILRPGESKKLSTPTMDAGVSILVTVHEIR
jgi:hypothetical protein